MKVLCLISSGTAPLRVALGLGETLALRAGPPRDEPLLSSALSLGAARALRVWDPILEGTDYLGLATAIAAAARHLSCRLIVAGDDGEGAVGPAVADRLDLPHLCGVLSAELSGPGVQPVSGPVPAGEAGERALLVQRRTAIGLQTLRGPAAAVLCVLPGEAAPEVQEAAPGSLVEVLGFGDLQLEPAMLGHRRNVCPREAVPTLLRRPLRFDQPEALVSRLRQDGLLPLPKR